MSMNTRLAQAHRVPCGNRKGLAHCAPHGAEEPSYSVKISDTDLTHFGHSCNYKPFLRRGMANEQSSTQLTGVCILGIACARGLSSMRRGARARSGERWLRQHLAILEDGAHAYA
jgi:hypothetical protein